MIVDFKIVHTCNHLVSNSHYVTADITVTRGSVAGNFFDPIIYTPDPSTVPQGYSSGVRILNIYKVTKSQGVAASTSDYVYYPETGYIYWLNNRPVNGTTYTVQAYILHSVQKQFDPTKELCPRCSNYGWYVDLLGRENGDIVTIGGVSKLGQEIMKMILTIPSEESVNPDYGTNIQEIPGRYALNDPKLLDMVAAQISYVESKYTEYQSSDKDIPDAERLSTLTLADIYPDEENSCLVVSIIVTSLLGDRATLNIPVES